MIYEALIEGFWRKGLGKRFTTDDVALYFYLLHVANAGGWKMPVAIADEVLQARFRFGKVRLIESRQRLQAANLIECQPDFLRTSYRYILLDAEGRQLGIQPPKPPRPPRPPKRPVDHVERYAKHQDIARQRLH